MTVTVKNKEKTPVVVTPSQRRIIDARLKQSLEEVKRGGTAGPFDTADAMIASLKQELRKPRLIRSDATPF
jgi:hypothetical protein